MLTMQERLGEMTYKQGLLIKEYILYSQYGHGIEINPEILNTYLIESNYSAS